MPRILLVDDEANILQVLSVMMKSKKFDVVTTTEGQKAIDMLKTEKFDLTISDMRMNPVDGMQVLKAARASNPDMPVLMLTAFGSQETAKQAVQLGAFGYMLKPFNLAELLIMVQRALTLKTQPKAEDEVVVKPAGDYEMADVVAESVSMKSVCETVRRLSSTNTPVLICGERGVGKSFIAKELHGCGPRRKNPFLLVNCATLPEPLLELEMFGYVKGAFASAIQPKKGLLESATTGTLLFDEIGWMPQNLQRKLLLSINEKGIRRVGGNENIPVDVHIVGTTIVPKDRLAVEGNLLKDLLAILNLNVIEIRPLRERKEDIVPIANRILKREANGAKVGPDVEPLLLQYAWPGNVREVENVIKASCKSIAGGMLTAANLPREFLTAVGK